MSGSRSMPILCSGLPGELKWDRHSLGGLFGGLLPLESLQFEKRTRRDSNRSLRTAFNSAELNFRRQRFPWRLSPPCRASWPGPFPFLLGRRYQATANTPMNREIASELIAIGVVVAIGGFVAWGYPGYSGCGWWSPFDICHPFRTVGLLGMIFGGVLGVAGGVVFALGASGQVASPTPPCPV